MKTIFRCLEGKRSKPGSDLEHAEEQLISQSASKESSVRGTEDGLWTSAAAWNWLQSLSHVTVLESQASSETGTHLLPQRVALWPWAGSFSTMKPWLALVSLLLLFLFTAWPTFSEWSAHSQVMENFLFSGTLHVNVTVVDVPAFRFNRWTVFRSRAASQPFHLELIKCVFLPKIHAHSSQLQQWQKHVYAQIYKHANYLLLYSFIYYYFWCFVKGDVHIFHCSNSIVLQ